MEYDEDEEGFIKELQEREGGDQQFFASDHDENMYGQEDEDESNFERISEDDEEEVIEDLFEKEPGNEEVDKKALEDLLSK